VDSYGLAPMMQDVRAIKQLLDDNNIELILFFQPTYLPNVKRQNLPLIELMKQTT